MSLPNGAVLSLDGVSATTEGAVVRSGKSKLSCGYFFHNGGVASGVSVQLQVRGQPVGPWIDLGPAMTGLDGGFYNAVEAGGAEARLTQTGSPVAAGGNPNTPKLYGWVLWY